MESKRAVVGLFSLSQGFPWGVYGRTYIMHSQLYSVHQLIIDIHSRKASIPDTLNSITQLGGTMKDS